MEMKLVVQSGKQAGKEIPVRGEKFLIGRGSECQLRPQSSLVSRRHCLIRAQKDSATVEDCGSTNGTLLNGEKVVERQELAAGDRLQIGMLELEVRMAVPVVEEKKPHVHSIQEAAARTAGAAPAAPRDLDISGWIGEGAETSTKLPQRESPTPQETIVANGTHADTTPMPVAAATPHPTRESPTKGGEKKLSPAKSTGKFHVTKPKAESSGAAADDVLRQFFHIKKK